MRHTNYLLKPVAIDNAKPRDKAYPTHGPTALPSLHRLDSRTLCGIPSYC
jgi:hypothetical protein